MVEAMERPRAPNATNACPRAPNATNPSRNASIMTSAQENVVNAPC